MKPRTAFLAALLLSFPCRSAIAAAWPGGSGTEIGAGLPGGYEPSGAVWHDGLGVLFVVSDGGYVSRMGYDGSSVTTWGPGEDLEAIAVADSSSNYVYLGVENPDSIEEFDFTTGALTGKSWDLTTWMTGPSNSGLEALTFVPDGHHPYGETRSGGLFYAGLQQDGTSPYDGRLYVFDVNLSSSGDVDYVANWSPVVGRTDLSDMFYDIHTRTLYLIYDSSNYIREVATDGTYITEYTLAGSDQEGICFVRTSPSSGYIYLGQDSGGVKRYAGYPVVDSDADGLTDMEEYWHDGAAAYTPGSDTNPSSADTDGDTFTDYIEAQSGTDPLDAGDAPETVHLNFQPFTLAPPSGGCCIDSGTARASTGYGW